MQEQDHIKELFSETFKNFEEPVRPELWNNIAAKISTTPSSAPSGSEAGVGAAKVTGSIVSWIAGAAIVISGISGYYYFNTVKSSTNTDVQTPAAQTTELPAIIEQIDPDKGTVATDNSSSQIINQKTITAAEAPINPAKVKSVKGETGNQVTGIHGDSGQPEGSKASEPAKLNQPNIQKQQSHLQAGNPTNSDQNNSKPAVKATPGIGYAPLSVEFTLSGDIQKSVIEFGDGSSENKTTNFSHTFIEPGIYSVNLKTYDSKGEEHSETIKIEVVANLNISDIPNIFTPNQDGSNDYFRFKVENLKEIEVTIFDKSGKQVTKFNNPEVGWDGNYSNGREALAGTYFYVIFATGNENQKHQQGGTITLIR